MSVASEEILRPVSLVQDEPDVTVPAPRGVAVEETTPERSSRCSVTVAHPTPGAAVLQVGGELVQDDVWPFKRAILDEVRTDVHTVIVDLNEVAFLDVTALHTLSAAKQCAKLNRTELLLVTENNPAVLRALRAGRVAAASLLEDQRTV
ncbi:STAS domain-containing protein [Allosaccharopolyspora coralli]|uniref:STAS domain-containing protein n=1 Tax=Allosaccharopolyspora coralli TaxID=2665642 RepID=UPI00165256E8|nr:STAS domain-containing protein [Allosaccharopolyspora coralli]